MQILPCYESCTILAAKVIDSVQYRPIFQHRKSKGKVRPRRGHEGPEGE